MDPLGQNQGVSKTGFHTETLGRSSLCLFQLLGAGCIPWLMTSTVHLEGQQCLAVLHMLLFSGSSSASHFQAPS